ncbi:MAG: DUF3341 domain-containing protein [Sandaracinaceae bacterium]|nr:DUF3341 domain-containing protein [Sandaracinaceae bacterium]MDW8246616.1 DUF3341 domain-containing protein [Sandaracinaceae bacterium]
MTAKTTYRPLLYLAEFETPAQVLKAAERVRDAGYRKWDVHTPFPIHGMDRAMGLPDSRLGWIVLACGLTGCFFALGLIWWANGVDYPLIIGGKAPFSLPSSVPVMFELTVLFSAFGAVLGMLGLNRLPMHHHPLFQSERFERATDDRFFISIEASDEKFDIEETRAFLESLSPSHIELIEEEVQFKEVKGDEE